MILCNHNQNLVTYIFTKFELDLPNYFWVSVFASIALSLARACSLSLLLTRIHAQALRERDDFFVYLCNTI